MRRVLFLGISTLISVQLWAQQGTIEGSVTDARSGETLIGVNLVLEDRSGTTTGVEGTYSIQVSPGKHTVLFRFVGYENQTKEVEVVTGQILTIDVSMTAASTQLDMVVVSASKHEQKLEEVTVSMEVIKPELVENKNTKDLEDFMQQVPGVHVMEGQCNIRGGSGYSYGAGSRVMILVDDLPLLAPDAQDAKWNTLPIENMKQLEVIKGASSALFGSSALNGVVNIRTSYPSDEPETRINVFHGVYSDPTRTDTLGNRLDSLGEVRKPTQWWDNANPTFTGANFFHSRKIGKQFDLVVGGNVYNDQGYREGENEQRYRFNGNTRYRVKGVEGLSAGVNFNHQKADGRFFFLWADADSGALRPQGGLDTATTTLSNYTTYRTNVDPFVVWHTKKAGRHSLRNRWYRTNNLNDTQQDARGDMFYSEYQFQYEFKKNLRLTTGAVTNFSYVRSGLYGDHDATNYSGFLQVDKKFGNRFNISFGARGEYFRVDTAETQADLMLPKGLRFTDSTTVWRDTIFLGRNMKVKPVFRLGMNYQLTQSTFIRASYGGGYRFPSIGEKFVNTSVGQLNIFPNPALQPETGWSTEIGIKQAFKISNWKGYLDVAGFWTEYQNMMEFNFGFYIPDTLDPSFFPNNPGFVPNWIGFQSQNVGNARVNGIETTLMGTGNIGPIGVSILAGHTYMNPVNLTQDSAYLASISDTTSNLLKYRFRHLAKADLQLDWKKWSLGVSMRYNSFMVNIDRDFEDGLYFGNLKVAEILPGLKKYRQHYGRQGDFVWDARMSWQLSKESKVALIISNFMNHEYMGRPGDIQPPRTVALQYTLAF